MLVTKNEVILTKNEELEEVWEDVTGYSGVYKVSSFGRVKKYYKTRDCKIIKHFITHAGYPVTYLITNKTRKNVLTSRLVAHAFITNPHGLLEVNHKNGIVNDNRVENLEWCTRSQNIKHSYEELNHLRMSGMSNGNSKLSEDQVKKICVFLDAGILTHQQIAEKFNITRALVSAIHEGKIWVHLTDRTYVKPKHRNSSLSEKDVIDIYTEAWLGETTSKLIGKKYGISGSTVRNIKCGESWGEVTKHVNWNVKKQEE